jgi:hypothetical protein
MQIHELNKQPTNTLLTEKDVNEVSQAKLASIRKKAVAEKAKDTADYQRAINKALPADPGTNQPVAQPIQQQAAQQPASVPRTPGWMDKTKAIGKATAAGWKQGGLTGAIKNNLSWDPYYKALDKVTRPAATTNTPQATLMAKLAPTGLTQKGLLASGSILQQASNGNKIIKKTGDQNVDSLLTSMGYTLQ